MPIFDQGYQHWHGPLSGRPWRWLSIARHGVRAQFKNRLARMVILFAWLPALSLAAFLVCWGLLEQNSDVVLPLRGFLTSILNPEIVADPLKYRQTVWTLAYDIFFLVEMYFVMILIVLVGPNLISGDLRFNAIPLYFSRPLYRSDYFAGKLGVIAFYLLAVTTAPALLAYVLGVSFSMDISIVKDTAFLLLAIFAYGAVAALSAGMLMLALSSLSRNSRYVGAMWIGVWLVGNVVAQVLSGIAGARWCYLPSYTNNLFHMEAFLLNTDAAWGRINQPGWKDLQYPWYWSAGVLAGLFGLSLWILTSRVKSLDRLK
jgi:ABC-2 type transport system permease protein